MKTKRIRKDRPLVVPTKKKHKAKPRPTALQRLAQELKTFDWHHDPNETDTPAARQEYKIKSLIKQCQEQEVRDLWEQLAPTAKFPTPFGLKPIKQPKPDKRNKSLHNPIGSVYDRRKLLTSVDPSGEMAEWDRICLLIRASEATGKMPTVLITEPKLCKEFHIDKETAILAPKANFEVEQNKQNRRKMVDNRLTFEFDNLVKYLDEGMTSISDLEQTFGKQNAHRIVSETNRIRAARKYEQLKLETSNGIASQAVSSTVKQSKPQETGATTMSKKITTTATDKTNPKSKSNGGVKRPKIFGHSATAILRWMGKQDYTVEEARKALEKMGASCSDSTIKSKMGTCHVTKAKHGDDYIPAAKLSPDEVSQLNKAAGRKKTKA